MLDFFSDMCGVIGLWFGFALMTFLEFLEFFVDFIVMTIGKLSKRCRFEIMKNIINPDLELNSFCCKCENKNFK